MTEPPAPTDVLRAALFVCLAGLAAAAELRLTPLTDPVARGRLLELRVDGLPRYANPFDPSKVAVDGEVVAPSGERLAVPAFWVAPHRAVRPPAEKRIVTHMRVFFGTRDWRQGERIELLLDDLALVDRETGERVVLDDFEGPLRWQKQRADAVELDARRAGGGKRCLRVAVTVGKERGWPGAGLDLGGADWTRFGELRLWVCPLAGLREHVPGIEFYTQTQRKVQAWIRALEGAQEGDWREFVWKLPPTKPPLVWEPSDEPEWRLRLRPQEAGEYRLRGRVRDASGERLGPWTVLRVADGETDGYLRVSEDDRRYLAFDSGKPFFANGINLLGRDLDTYRHYVGRLADHGGNFIRIWLSPRTMGFVTKEGGPLRYEQGKATQLDALLELCEARGVFVMVCVTDFREADTRNPGSYWKDSAWHAANGGACQEPEDFFASEAAKAHYRALLRYLVARYGHSPNVLAWEFFNEVNITDGWRNTPEAVRAWHREMAAHLRRIDPQQHVITSSFAGMEDDALWEQPRMEIAQRHQYIDGEQSFAALVAEAHAKLRHRGKPVLMGEFGRRRNRFAALDSQGVSLHNGLWAGVLSGGCGTAMSWWWQWIDEHGLWPRFASVAAFVEGIEWPAEGFQPSEKAAVRAEPDPEHGFGPVVFAPTAGGFRPAPFNQPVELRVDARGKLDAPGTLPRILHGVRNHPGLHNPVTFHAELPRPGRFAVAVDGVSGHGGATLELKVDGKMVRRDEFADASDDTRTMTQFNGSYSVPVPAGRHTVTAENTGKDWLIVRCYAFDAARADPPVRVLWLRGHSTTLVWVWNESHAWYRPVYRTPLLRLSKVVVALPSVAAGRHRVRPFDPWAGRWGGERAVTVGQDGKLLLAIGELTADTAFRVEQVE